MAFVQFPAFVVIGIHRCWPRAQCISTFLFNFLSFSLFFFSNCPKHPRSLIADAVGLSFPYSEKESLSFAV